VKSRLFNKVGAVKYRLSVLLRALRRAPFRFCKGSLKIRLVMSNMENFSARDTTGLAIDWEILQRPYVTKLMSTISMPGREDINELERPQTIKTPISVVDAYLGPR
jgi:hypothetical protein